VLIVTTKELAMAAEKDRWFQMRADERFFEKLDFIRKQQEDLPNRAEMVRRLIDEKMVAISLKKPK
jgi:hypothetical protein